MTFGITCYNNNGELTISSEAQALCYLGKATQVSYSHYSGTSSSSQCGGSVYQFVSAGPVVAAIGLNSSGQAGAVITGMFRHDATTWYFNVVDLTTATEGPTGTTYQVPNTASDIFVFGTPSSVSGYGMALYDSSGNLTVDLSKPLFTPIARVSMTGQTGYTFTLPTTPIRPAVVGYPHISVNTHTSTTASHYSGMWTWSGGTSFGRANYLTDKSNDSGAISSNTTGDCVAIVIEASGFT